MSQMLRLGQQPSRTAPLVKIPVLLKDDRGTPLQDSTAAVAIRTPRGWVTSWTSYADSRGRGFLEVDPAIANLPMTFTVLPAESLNLEPGMAEVSRSSDGSLTLTLQRQSGPLQRAINFTGILLVGAGLGILGYIGFRWYQKSRARA